MVLGGLILYYGDYTQMVNLHEKNKRRGKKWREYFSKETITAISKREKINEENI